ncbi:hypothetical protein ACJZ2D_004121 [Fusarium nematophilum]
MSSAEDELSRRRERGRQSQAAFRKRQTQATRHLTDQNRRLKDGIQKLVDAIHGDERPELLDLICDLATEAGVNNVRPNLCALGPHVDADEITIHVPTRNIIRGPKNIKRLPLVPSPSPERLTCQIWLDPLNSMRVSLAPEDILPYLGPGSTTFAGRLFWSVMEHTQGGCKSPHSDTASLIRTALSHSRATRDIKASFIRNMADARLEYKRTGSIGPENAAAGERDLGMVLHERVEKDYRERGKDPSLWLSLVAIERRVRGIAGDAAFALLEEAAADRGGVALKEMLNGIKCSMSDEAVCFGDGPRWHIEVVDKLFLGCIAEAIGSIPSLYCLSDQAGDGCHDRRGLWRASHTSS